MDIAKPNLPEPLPGANAAQAPVYLQYLGEAIIITETSGIIQYVNPAFERMTGYTKTEVYGKHTRILNSGTHHEAFHRDLWETIKQGKVWHGRMTSRRKDGSTYETESTITPTSDSSGNTFSFVSIQREITSEAKIQARLREMQHLETLGSLAGGIAHDFNNILTGILGYTDLAMSLLDEEDQALEYLRQVMIGGEQANKLIRQILALSRRIEEERRPIDIQTIVKEALKLLRATLPKSVEVTQGIDCSCSPVLADATQIYQVITNLYMNALHAMRENGGTLEITLDEVQFESQHIVEGQDFDAGRYVRLTLSDTGHGMNQETIDRIFEPGFTTKGKDEGTGLGLATVRGIVASHNGRITVHSEPGKGSRFVIVFPVHSEAIEPIDETSRLGSPEEGSEHILFISDVENFVEPMRVALARIGYDVTVCPSSAEALHTFQANPDTFDVIVTTDASTEGFGADLVGELLAIRPGFPIIVCTESRASNGEEITDASPNLRRLVRPVENRDLAHAIRKVIALNPAFAQTETSTVSVPVHPEN